MESNQHSELRELLSEAVGGGRPWMVAYWPIPEPHWWVGVVPESEVSSKMAGQVTGPLAHEPTAKLIAQAPDLARRVIDLKEQLEAVQTALAPFAKAGKKLIHQGSQGYRNGTYDDLTETYTFRVGDVIAAYKIAGTSDPGGAPQSGAPQSDEPSGARSASFPAKSHHS